jgi:hypothetical protein
MNLDDLIPFLIFAGIVIFNILKARAKKEKGLQNIVPDKNAPTQKTFGIAKILKAVKDEIEKAGVDIKQESQDATTDSTWDALSENNEGSSAHDTEPIKQEEDTTSPVEPFEPSTDSPEMFLNLKKIPDIIEKPDLKIKKQKKVLILSPSTMRNAVILSEIIAKPIGLR